MENEKSFAQLCLQMHPKFFPVKRYAKAMMTGTKKICKNIKTYLFLAFQKLTTSQNCRPTDLPYNNSSVNVFLPELKYIF
jgi:hypothetical protein